MEKTPLAAVAECLPGRASRAARIGVRLSAGSRERAACDAARTAIGGSPRANPGHPDGSDPNASGLSLLGRAAPAALRSSVAWTAVSTDHEVRHATCRRHLGAGPATARKLLLRFQGQVDRKISSRPDQCSTRAFGPSSPLETSWCWPDDAHVGDSSAAATADAPPGCNPGARRRARIASECGNCSGLLICYCRDGRSGK